MQLEIERVVEIKRSVAIDFRTRAREHQILKLKLAVVTRKGG
jgi:hypothetical protein